MKAGPLVSIVMAACVILVSGCASLDARNQAEKLERSVTQYGAALRWARHREAISFHVTREAKFAEVDIEYLDEFSVTSFDVLSQTS